MKYLNKLATVFCAAALGLMALTSCEGGDLYSIDSPDWISSKADSIAAEKAKNQSGEEEIEGMQEDVYTIGATILLAGGLCSPSIIRFLKVRSGSLSST